MSYKIAFYPELCVACGACSVACMDQNDIYPQNGDEPFRKVFQKEYYDENGRAHISYHSSACRHCDEAACIAACPLKCLSKDPETCFTVYNYSECIGCGRCQKACPFGIPVIGTEGKMMKCHGCNDRVKNGFQPACVSVCPFGALRLEKPEN